MHPLNRQTTLEKIAQQSEMDVVIVGGGINGIGLFRELAQQDLKVLLIEQNDYCSGASAAPSRMIHGGLRYLENAEYSLVKESLHERDLLLKNAPHYVQPLATTIPIFSWFDGLFTSTLRFAGLTDHSCNRGALVIKLGLHVYDVFCAKHTKMPRHSFKFSKATHQHWQGLNRDLRCSATYYDAWISHPERLALEMIKESCAQFSKALACNYLALTGVEQQSLQLADKIDNQILTVRTKALVNASGAWIDFTNQKLAKPSRLIGGTKGSHLILDNPLLHSALNGNMMYFENQEGRVCIVFPYFDKVLVGSTDIKVDDPDDIYCTPQERDYIFESLQYIFPNIPLAINDICFTYSGVRPLPSSNAQSNGQISRSHSIHVQEASDSSDFPIYSMIGGKWTTFRAFAEQMCERLSTDIGFEIKSNSRHQAIGGGKNYPNTPEAKQQWIKDYCASFTVCEARAAQLLDRYGTNAYELGEYIKQQGLESLSQSTDSLAGVSTYMTYSQDYSRAEIQFLIDNEQVESLLDIVLRRTNIAISGALHMSLLIELNTVLSQVKNWDSQRAQSELTQTLLHLEKFHTLTNSMLVERSQTINHSLINSYDNDNDNATTDRHACQHAARG